MNDVTNPEENNDKDSRVKYDDKNISSVISGKILDYKKKLDSIPIELVPVDESEKDRQEVNDLYKEIELPSTQLLDSKFYTQILKMNRERDKSFLKEGTTRKERIVILAQFINRVTTPILYLNQKRNIHLSNFFILDNKEKNEHKQQKEETVYNDPTNTIQTPKELTQLEITNLKNSVIKKVENKTWTYNQKPSLDLTDWEADILSQLIRDEELQIFVDKNNRTTKIVRGKNKRKDTRIISYLIEPEKENSEH